jgi:ribosome-binding protein aMBF1 (putative translation factor)
MKGHYFMAPGSTRRSGGLSGSDAGSSEVMVSLERQWFATNLRKARKASGITQMELRARTGFSQSFISEAENGITAISLDNAAQLARAVGLPLADLIRAPE